VKEALAAGKHVVCEKPLALTAGEAAELVSLAEDAGVVHCTNFMARFYPLVQQARALVRDGALGEIWNVHGRYLQDWLLKPTDWNWRLEPERGGELRAIGDIGSHWLDLVQFVTGQRIAEVLADLQTVLPVRRRPSGPVQTFERGAVEGEDVAIATEDLAHVLLRFDGGARGAVVVSQVSAGRKNALEFEIDGSEGSVAWSSERPEELWLGRREKPNEVLLREPALLAPAAREATALPGGHAEGFAETFRELYSAFTEPWRPARRRRSRTTRPSPTATGRACSGKRSQAARASVRGSRRPDEASLAMPT
jgi:predicted dehydrogenase